MSIYKELNEVRLDVEQYEAERLSTIEKKRWEKRVLKKIKKQKPSGKKKLLAATAAIILAAWISMSTGLVSVAKMPFVSGKIEEYIGHSIIDDELNVDTSLKTTVGETAQNKYGTMTLNEVLIDGGRLLISATFEPSEGVHFDYQMHPLPTVLINGHNLTTTTGGQSIERNDSMFSIYNEVELKGLPTEDNLQVRIAYDHLDADMPIENPWIFDINVPTEQLAAMSETIDFNQALPIGHGQVIHLQKMIVTPISTVVYYHWPEETDHIAFKIVSESGDEIHPYFAAITGEDSYNRFKAIDLQSEKYYLVPYDDSHNPNADSPARVPEQRIPVNP